MQNTVTDLSSFMLVLSHSLCTDMENMNISEAQSNYEHHILTRSVKCLYTQASHKKLAAMCV